MRIESANTGPCELWTAWVDDYVVGVTARCASSDDVLDLIMRGRDVCSFESALISNVGVSYACRNSG